MNEIILDTNVFILFIVGLIHPSKINSHKKLSIYCEEDFNYLRSVISNYKTILTNPNVITEVDNLLNNFSGDDKLKYIEIIKNVLEKSKEKYIESKQVMNDKLIFYDVGLTDTVIIEMAKSSDLLVSGDSKLCDIAKSLSINVLDFKEYVNKYRYS